MLDRHEVVVDSANVVGMSGEGGAQDDRDADCVVVDVRFDISRADRVLVGFQRHDPWFDVEVAAELLPYDVHVAAEHEIRPVDTLVFGLHAVAPSIRMQRRSISAVCGYSA